LRDEEETDQERDHGRDEPRRDLQRERLERSDVAPLPVMPLEVDRLLPEQLTVHDKPPTVRLPGFRRAGPARRLSRCARR